MPQLSEEARLRVTQALGDLDVRLRQEAIARVASQAVVKGGTGSELQVNFVTSLLRVAIDSASQAEGISHEFKQLQTDYERARTRAAQKQVLLRHIQNTEKNAVQLAGDVAALRKWFDLEALSDRFTARIANAIDDATIAYNASISLLGSDPSAKLPDPATVSRRLLAHLKRIPFESLRELGLSAITAIARQVMPEQRLMIMGTDVFVGVSEIANGELTTEVWTQRAAMTTLTVLTPHRGIGFVQRWLAPREQKDDMLRRHHAVRLLPELPAPADELTIIAKVARDDPSQHVRQGLARVLAELETSKALAELALLATEDASSRVRGYATLELTQKAPSNDMVLSVLVPVLCEHLQSRSKLHLRVAFESIGRCASLEQLPRQRLAQELCSVANADDLPAHLCLRAAAMIRLLAVKGSPRLDALAQKIATQLSSQPESHWGLLEVLPEYSSAEVELCALVAGSLDLGLALRPRRDGSYRILRGETRRPRLWRLIYELGHPAPDKRQGYPHTHAPSINASALIPPVLMAEVTQTSVPGERLLGPHGEWGIFLPRVDDLLIAIKRRQQPLRIVTDLGTLIISAPDSVFRRRWLGLLLSFRYAQFAAARESALTASGTQRKAYIDRLRRLGFGFRWTAQTCHVGEQEYHLDPACIRDFF